MNYSYLGATSLFAPNPRLTPVSPPPEPSTHPTHTDSKTDDYSSHYIALIDSDDLTRTSRIICEIRSALQISLTPQQL